eukprot:TRINITY_DN2088_c0_g1_i2.p1 TRINITY_DN2088_c0_g1~~TRINITY_DN2088_c0_g1_i2.p1  ORF type:complete len:132 (+),score=17.34 TRINITY_DN2088_c0_g1_i2:625-1020(+)
MRNSSDESEVGSYDVDVDITDDDMPPPLLEEYNTPDEPCNHNMWDNLRTKKEVVSLRCRVCAVRWKAGLSYLRERKCSAFVKSCPVKDCPMIHIFKYKIPSKTRTKLQQQRGSTNSTNTQGFHLCCSNHTC